MTIGHPRPTLVHYALRTFGPLECANRPTGACGRSNGDSESAIEHAANLADLSEAVLATVSVVHGEVLGEPSEELERNWPIARCLNSSRPTSRGLPTHPVETAPASRWSRDAGHAVAAYMSGRGLLGKRGVAIQSHCDDESSVDASAAVV
jgi:hypothetical protein